MNLIIILTYLIKTLTNQLKGKIIFYLIKYDFNNNLYVYINKFKK